MPTKPIGIKVWFLQQDEIEKEPKRVFIHAKKERSLKKKLLKVPNKATTSDLLDICCTHVAIEVILDLL